MVIFNSYVKLPEGIWIINHLLESTSLDLPRAAQEKHIAVAKLLIEVETPKWTNSADVGYPLVI